MRHVMRCPNCRDVEPGNWRFIEGGVRSAEFWNQHLQQPPHLHHVQPLYPLHASAGQLNPSQNPWNPAVTFGPMANSQPIYGPYSSIPGNVYGTANRNDHQHGFSSVQLTVDNQNRITNVVSHHSHTVQNIPEVPHPSLHGRWISGVAPPPPQGFPHTFFSGAP